MAKNKNIETGFSRRSRIIARYGVVSFFVLLFTAFTIYKLVCTTVIDADKWNEKANKDLARVDTVKPIRGDILACDGSILATNVISYTAAIDFSASRFMRDSLAKYLNELCDTMALHFPHRDARQWQALFAGELSREKPRSYVVLLRNITHEQSESLRRFPFFRLSDNPNYNGLVITGKKKREYPYGDMAKRSIGRVNEQPNGEIHGYSGLEYALDSLLYGVPGIYKKVPLTSRIANWVDVAAIKGKTIITTIDITLQDITETALSDMLKKTRARWGTAVLMETATGDIKAISNLDYDTITGRVSEAMNHAMRRIEPGSTIKAISMLIALEDGYAGNLDAVYKTDSWRFGNHTFAKQHPEQCSPRMILGYSSNLGIAKLVAPHFADDPNRYRERVRQLGMLEPLGTGIAGEVPPYFPHLDIKSGGLVTLVQQTFGYGASLPPIYTCAFYNAIANDGRFVRPRIIRGFRTAHGDSILNPTYVRDRICSSENARLLREMLRLVVSHKGCTGYNFLHDSPVPLAGKTGTAKVAKEKKPGQTDFVSGYKADRWKHYTFCGFFPADKPRYTCIVVISEPAKKVGAASSSGMVLRDIATKMNARGLLSDAPDYHKDPVPQERVVTPTVYTVGESMPKLQSALGVNKVRTYKNGNTVSVTRGIVPDVHGMGIRQAVKIVEAAGFRVNIRGNGYVAAQTPAAGTRARAGGTVTLTMQ